MTAFDINSVASDFHATYELLAQSFGYKTRDDTKTFDACSPNGRLMIAVCKEVIGRHNLAPRLTPKELEAKIDAVTREWDKYNTSFADVRSAIRREFSTVACGDGVDWKAKYQSAKEELEESEHARHLQIEELASVHSEIEAAERERDALAARVKELESGVCHRRTLIERNVFRAMLHKRSEELAEARAELEARKP